MRRRGARDPVLLGLAGAVVLALAVAFVFVQRVPFVERYEVVAVLSSSNQLREGAPVRIAGVDVGRVASIGKGPGGTTAVTLEVADEGRPVHRDATLKVRPRLFLEGGFYVDLKPGSPSAPELGDGGTIPLPQTAVPVQFNQVLNTLDRPTRASLRAIIARTSSALAKGAAKDLAAAARPSVPALRDTAIVTEAARGTRPRDVSELVAALSRITGALASGEAQLARAVDAYDRTLAAFAAESEPLARSVAAIDRLLRRSPRALRAIDAALPPTTRLAVATRPALRIAPPVLRDLATLLTQLRGLSRPAELPRLVARLDPTVRRLPTFSRRLRQLFRLVAPVSQCLGEKVLPVFEQTAPDGALSTHQPIWKDLLHGSTGLASAISAFDSNGPWIRYVYNLGTDTLSLQDTQGAGPLLAHVAPTTLRQRPTPLPVGTDPPLKPEASCLDQPRADLSSRASGTLAAPDAQRTRGRQGGG